MELTPFATSIMTAIFVSGAAWGATKAALNGTKMRVQEVHKKISDHIKEEADADKETHQRIARVETKIDMILERYK